MEHKIIRGILEHMKESVKMSRKLIIDGKRRIRTGRKLYVEKETGKMQQTEKNQMEERRRTQEKLNEYKRMLKDKARVAVTFQIKCNKIQ